jgi:hypothetical protein
MQTSPTACSKEGWAQGASEMEGKTVAALLVHAAQVPLTKEHAAWGCDVKFRAAA